jgi:stage II sporulation protein R
MKDIDLKQKCILSLILVIVMGVVLFYTYEDAPSNQYRGIIRLHVIANSDSESDQTLKLKVRDEILKHMSSVKGSDTVENTRDYLKTHLRQMKQIADKVIEQNDKYYTASADLRVRWIPEKTYGETHFPAGNYEALDITLGEGGGLNWWCVLFPPLCLIEEDPDNLEALDSLDLKNQEQIQLKSKLFEILNRKQT